MIIIEAKEIKIPRFTVVGFRIEASLDEIESGMGKNTYNSLISRKDEILYKKNENVILMQIYPMKPGFNPRIDRFTQIFCYEVVEGDSVPPGMIRHQVPESKYVTYTHKGLESELGRSYDYLYGQWMREHGHELKGYDFEIWDERYKPESSDNEIDMYVAIGGGEMDFPTHIVAAGATVENKKGEILLVKNRHTGSWVFPGGQVEVGENIIDGLVREVKEESGIDIIVSYLVGIYSNTATYEGFNGVKVVPTKVMFDYVCEPIGGELTTSNETSECRWVEKNEVLNMITAPAIRTRFQAYLDFEGKVVYMEYVTKPEFDLRLKRNV